MQMTVENSNRVARPRHTIQSSNYLNERLITQICETLSQRDIISVIQTCHFWYQVATPKLYRRIIINGSQCQDNCTLTKLQFDNESDLKFDSWMNFKIPIKNLSKLYQSLHSNKQLIQYIRALEIFDCYKTELRFYILQILELILKYSEGNFKLFKCHHTTSNQFYYQCLCYQDYWVRLMKYIRGGNNVNTLCLNFNDFIRCFLVDTSDMEDDYFKMVTKFEIIINSYELTKMGHGNISMGKVEKFFRTVLQLTINNNFEVFTNFVNKFEDFRFDKLHKLNVNIEYMSDDILKFCKKLKYLTHLSLNFENDDIGKEEEFPSKLLLSLKKSELTHFSIKLNNKGEIFDYINDDNFGKLTHLSVSNNFNDFGNYTRVINSNAKLTYLNYQFKISTSWLLNNKCECGTCQNMVSLPNHEMLIKVFIDDLFPLISPKYDYRYLDQDLNLDEYPIGKITVEILQRINKDNHINLNMVKCFLVLNFIKHVLQRTYLKFGKSNDLGGRFEYLSIGGVPFARDGDCLFDLVV